MSEFDATLSEYHGAAILKLSGEARLSIESLEKKTAQLIAESPPLVVVDLSELTFLSSLTMGSLVKLHRGIKAHGGKVTLAGPQPRIREALQYAHLDTLLGVCDTVENAVESQG